MERLINQAKQSRLGFHYYPDAKHYSQRDLQKWLPELQALGASWLVLNSPMNRAVPEFFIRGLLASGIEPIIRFDIPLGDYLDPAELKPILDVYADWGVNAVIFFDKPNSRSSWSTQSWIQQDLVEQFLEQFIPLADVAIEVGLIPVFPPLEPGGNYWDTTFLRMALESLVRREQGSILEKLTLSAYPWTHHHPLNWGAGGPSRWPQAKPYFSPEGEQDHRGFRIFDWYLAITRAVLGRTCPILLLEAGIPASPLYYFPETGSDLNLVENNFAMIKLLNDEPTPDPADERHLLEQIPPEVVSCSFWLLTTDADSQFLSQAWYKQGSPDSEIVQKTKDFFTSTRKKMAGLENTRSKKETDTTSRVLSKKILERGSLPQPIKNYILLPRNQWGLADWHLEVIRPYVKKYQPTIGFSIQEAALSERVIVVGNTQAFPEDVLDRLRYSGTIVERISGNGTTIATNLAER